MKNFRSIPLSIFAGILLLAAGSAQAQVHDNANIFSQSAVDQANAAMTQMQERHNKQFVVETYAKLSDDQLAQLQQLGDQEFFDQWLMERAKYENVNGVYALVCLDPAHHYIDIRAGKNTTARGEFTNSDANRVRQQMKTDFHNKEYDQGLLAAVDQVEQIYTTNITAHNGGNYSSGAAAPAWTSPAYPNPTPNNNNYNYHTSSGGGFGSLICGFIGLMIIISLIRSIFHGGYGGGFGNWGGGMGGYGGYGGYGGGGGFGSGIMGGLLGGVLGGEADRWIHGNNSSGGFMQGGGFGGGGSAGGGGGSFDSGPSDFGGGFGGGGGGGDFGGGGGGAGSGGSF